MPGTQAVEVPKMLSIVTWGMLVVAPVVYLIVAQFLEVATPVAGAPYDMVTYILLVVAIIEPLPFMLIERTQISNFRKTGGNGVSRGQFYMNVAIIGMAPVCAIYIFGFVVFMIGGEFVRMLYFYPIGLVWTRFRWPTEARREVFFRKLEVS